MYRETKKKSHTKAQKPDPTSRASATSIRLHPPAPTCTLPQICLAQNVFMEPVTASLPPIQANSRRIIVQEIAKNFHPIPNSPSPSGNSSLASHSPSTPPNFFDLLDFEHLLDNLPALRQVQGYQLDYVHTLPDSPREDDTYHFLEGVIGNTSNHGDYVMELANGCFKFWHKQCTWKHIVRSPLIVSELIPLEDDLGSSDYAAGNHSSWTIFVALILNRMIVVSAGLQYQATFTDKNNEGIIALQTIREMLHIRRKMRTALTRLRDARLQHSSLSRYGFPDVLSTSDAQLRMYITNADSEDSFTSDLRFLNPRNWIKKSDLVRGLLSWVNAEIRQDPDIQERITVPMMLTEDVLTIHRVDDWCNFALQFERDRTVESAVAFIGILRFMFASRIEGQNSSMFTIHLCANEFLDDAVAVPELESCLPKILGLEKYFRRGFEIDTGPITHTEVIDFLQEADRPVPHLGGVSVRGLPKASIPRTVMAIRTKPLTDREWNIPKVPRREIEFEIEGESHRMVVEGERIFCAKTSKVGKIKKLLRRIVGVQIPLGVGEVGITLAEAEELSRDWGNVAVSHALSLKEYGDDAMNVCKQVLCWLHRGTLKISPKSTAAVFVPKSSLDGNMVINQVLSYRLCRKMTYARKDQDLFWIPGDGLPPFKLRLTGNGTISPEEVDELPEGAKLCHANIARDFG